MAARRGWSWTGEPGTGFCGRLQVAARHWFVIGADLGVNPSGAARIARDKVFAQFFLKQAGLPTIPTRVLHSPADAESIADFPVLLKPNEGHGGVGVSVADHAADLAAAYKLARAASPLVLAQPVIEQREFRVMIFNRQPLLAYEKNPLALIGDGSSSIRELIHTSSLGRRTPTPALTDPRVTTRLRRCGFSPETILSPGQRFIPLPTANLQSGGIWRECLAELSPALLNAAGAAAETLGLVMAGVDLFAESPAADACVINEVNASPGLECLAAESALLDPLFAAIEEYLSRH
ncbi:MAG TPA: hypothetical protein VGO11_00735 [Chthoniobacteraceae bacterium]|nr:hypothetical protein [Chthoniobacteraceae bacterium]